MEVPFQDRLKIEVGMKRLFYLIVFLSIAFELWGCALNMILEFNDVSNFVVSEEKVEDDTVLTVSGLCMHSSYVVKKISLKKRDDKCSILIKISFIKKKNETGRFKYSFKIPDDVKKVVFGNKETVIWTKEGF